MPRDNCGFLGCHNSRSFFKIPTVSDKEGEDTRNKKEEAQADWIRIVCTTRVKDADLERQFRANTFHLCEIHFDLDDIDVFPKGKVLRTGSILTRNLPKKSFDAGENFKERRVVERKIQDPLLKPIYESFETVEKSIGKMKLIPWHTEVEKDLLICSLMIQKCMYQDSR